MKKFLFSFLLALVMLPVFMGASSCSIVHTHSYNAWGNCGVCSHSICEKLTYDGVDTYTSKLTYVEAYKKYYCKIEANAETKLTFYTGNENVAFDRIEVYYNTMAQAFAKLPSATAATRTVYTLTDNFMQGGTYYMVITFRNSGSVDLSISGYYEIINPNP